MKIFLSLTLVFLLISCSSSGSQDYLSIKENSPKTYANVKEAAKYSAKQKLEIGRSSKIKIRVTDPSFTEGGVINNFQAFEVDKWPKGTYGIAATSACYECLGFRKKVLYPQIYVFDKAYKNITPETNSKFHGFAAMAVRNGTFEVPNTDKYYVLIAADNTRLGGNNSSVTAQPDDIIFPLPYPISASAEGNVYFSIVKAQD